MTFNGNSARWLVATTTMLGTFMEVLDTSVANVALPHIQGTYSAGVDEITWVLTSYLVANAVILPVTGWIAAYFGRKRAYMACLLVFTIASFGAGAAPSLGFLILMRVIQGLAGGAMVPMSQAIMLEAFPKKEHGKATAFFGIGVIFAPILGPLVGGWITDNWSWPWIFYINIPVGLVAVFLSALLIEDPPYLVKPEGRVDVASFAFVAVGLGSLEVMLNRGERLDWFQSPFIKFFAFAAAAGIVLFVWRSLTAEHPLVDLSIFKDRQCAASMVLIFVVGFVLYGAFVMLPLLVQNLLNYTPTWAGLILSPGGVASLLALVLVGALSGRVDNRILVAVGVVFMAASNWLLHLATLSAGVPYYIQAWIYHGLGLGFLFVVLGVAAVQNLPPEKIGVATAFFNLMRNEGGSVGIAVATTVLAQRSQFHTHRLAEHVSPFNPLLDQAARELRGGLSTLSGGDASTLQQTAMGLLQGEVHRQAAFMAFLDVFWFLAVVMVLSLPLVLLLRRGRTAPGGLAIH